MNSDIFPKSIKSFIILAKTNRELEVREKIMMNIIESISEWFFIDLNINICNTLLVSEINIEPFSVSSGFRNRLVNI